MFFPARSTGQWWVRVDGAALPILFLWKFRLRRAEVTPSSAMVVPRSRPWVAVGVVADIEMTTGERPLRQQSADRVAVVPEIPHVAADLRPQEQRVRVLPARVVQGTGIPAAVVVRVGRVSAILLTADPACWFRFWVAIFTGAVAVVDPDIPLVAETVEWEVEVVERSIPLPEELG